MSKGSEFSNYLNTFVLIASAIGALVFFDDIKNSIATVNYHDTDSAKRQEQISTMLDQKLEPVVASSNEAIAMGLPARIKNLLINKCRAPERWTDDLQNLTDELIEKYGQVNKGRHYRVGECTDGVYYNSLGVPQ